MNVHKVTNDEIKLTADMTRQLFEDEPSNKHLTMEEFEQRLIDELKTKKIDLDIFCWNSRGRKFWESLGFQELAIIMRKEDVE